jgi:hypothetical protein
LEILLLLLLLVAAGVLLLPGMLKERELDSPLSTVSDFRRGMTALAPGTQNSKAAHGQYYLGTSEGDSEPYVRRGSYGDEVEKSHEEGFVPYPSSRARTEMETRRGRIIAVLLTVTLATGICALIPKLRWIMLLHVTMLLVLSIYIGLVILLPYYENRG